MSSKISVTKIICSHYKTLFMGSSFNTKMIDMVIFFIFPLAMTGLAMWAGLIANNDLVSLCVNFGSIFTALLLSVLVLVYDQENKIIDKENQSKAQSCNCSSTEELKQENNELRLNTNRLRFPNDGNKRLLMKELYSNIAYCIVVSVLLVATSAINLGVITIVKDAICDFGWINKSLFTPAMVFLSIHLLVTIVMVVKRLYSLLLTNED